MNFFMTSVRIYNIAILLLLACIVGACNQQSPTVPSTAVRYASTAAIVEAPAHIAFAKDFFKQEGLELELNIYPDGKTSLQKVVNGDADIGAVMSTPLVYESFANKDFIIISNLLHGKVHFAVVSKDSGITSPKDWIDKKIGVTKGTSGEFFMDSYFILEGVDHQANEIFYSTAQTSLQELEAGNLDAIFTWLPWPFLALDKLNGNGQLLETTKIVPSSWVVIANREFADNHPDVLEQFLRGLQKGIAFTMEKKEAAYALHTEVTGLSTPILFTHFLEMDFSLSLSNRLLLDLEQQAAWLVEKQYVGAQRIPNYLDFIDATPLANVLPNDVTLITK